jgi:hypothetical protein
MLGWRIVGEAGLGAVMRRASWLTSDLDARFPERSDVEKGVALPLRWLKFRGPETVGARVDPVIEGGVRPRVVGFVRLILDPCKLSPGKPEPLGVLITDGAERGALAVLRLGA